MQPRSHDGGMAHRSLEEALHRRLALVSDRQIAVDGSAHETSQVRSQVHDVMEANDGSDNSGSLQKPNQGRFRDQFWKTEKCRFYRHGCRRGASCPFAHGDDEIRKRPNLDKTSLCQNYVRGKCHLTAEQCQFAHSALDLRATTTYRKTLLCRNYQKGFCMLGSACRHAHGVTELAAQDSLIDGGASWSADGEESVPISDDIFEPGGVPQCSPPDFDIETDVYQPNTCMMSAMLERARGQGLPPGPIQRGSGFARQWKPVSAQRLQYRDVREQVSGSAEEALVYSAGRLNLPHSIEQYLNDAMQHLAMGEECGPLKQSSSIAPRLQRHQPSPQIALPMQSLHQKRVSRQDFDGNHLRGYPLEPSPTPAAQPQGWPNGPEKGPCSLRQVACEGRSPPPNSETLLQYMVKHTGQEADKEAGNSTRNILSLALMMDARRRLSKTTQGEEVYED